MPEVITNNLDLWSSAILTKSTAGRGSNGKQEAYGIKRLRELILELAVRGKLVHQDPNDEPASNLVKKIVAEKAELVAGGGLKEAKKLPDISEHEKAFELPDGWGWVRYGDLVKIITGKLDANAAVANGQYPFFTCSQTPSEIDSYSFDCQAVLLAGNGDFNVKYYTGKFDAYQRTYVIQPVCVVLKFLYYLTLAEIELITKNNRGSAIPYLKLGDITNPVIGLPPLNEQHRITAKVDELMALCDQLEQQQTHSIEAHQTLVETLLGTLTHVESQQELTEAWTRIANHFDTLFTTEHSIDQLKQTILQLAVMGKLVPQDPNDEPASVLLERIAQEKERLIKEGKIKKQSPLPEISDDEKLFEIPSDWAWARLQDVIDVRDGTHDSPKDAFGPDTYPLVTSKNFDDGRIDFDSARRISSKDHFEISKRSLVEKYDILFSMIGGNLGNQVMVKDDRQFSVKNVALFKYYNRDLTSPFFIKKYMEHLALYLQEKAIGGAQPFVSLGFLRNLVFALPPIEEQHRIVAKVDELMALCDALKERLNDAQTTQIHLADAIVEQAVA